MASVAVTGRADLSDAQWAKLEPLLPVGKRPGRPSKWTRRQLVDGIRWRVRAGAPWRDIPPAYGSWQAAYGLFRRWQRAGVWARILARLQARGDAAGLITWDVSVDSTIARAHQHAAGARKGGMRRPNRRAGWGSRSRPITRWDGRGVAGPPSCIWPSSRARSRCRWSLPRDNAVIRHSSRSWWVVSGWPGRDVAGPEPGRSGYWRTRHTVLEPTAPTCVVVVSGARSRRRPTRKPTARPRVVRVAAHQPSTRRSTSSATPWNAASTGSSATVP